MSGPEKLEFGVYRVMNKSIRRLAMFVLVFGPLVAAQNQSSADAKKNPSPVGKGVDYLLNYLNMAGTKKGSDFHPLTQRERTQLYLKTMVNPLGYIKAGFSAGIDQWKDKPPEWEQGASGYGKRFANIVGQYAIQRTVTFGLASGLHEDNRYFNSGKKGLWPRAGYAIASGILARHDDGSRHVSISQVGGVAAGAFLSRAWQPTSQHSAGDGAVSFGISMASNMGFSVVKEFLPDLGRMITNGPKSSTTRKFASGTGSTKSLRKLVVKGSTAKTNLSFGISRDPDSVKCAELRCAGRFLRSALRSESE